jgi:hypothetical protein
MIAKINNREHKVVYIDYRDGNIPHQVYTVCLDKYRQLFTWDFFANNGDKRDIRYYNAGVGGDKEIQASNWAKGVKGQYWLDINSCLDGKSNGKRLKQPLRVKGYSGSTSINPFMVAEETNNREYCEECGHESTEFCYEHKYEDNEGNERWISNNEISG